MRPSWLTDHCSCSDADLSSIYSLNVVFLLSKIQGESLEYRFLNKLIASVHYQLVTIYISIIYGLIWGAVTQRSPCLSGVVKTCRGRAYSLVSMFTVSGCLREEAHSPGDKLHPCSPLQENWQEIRMDQMDQLHLHRPICVSPGSARGSVSEYRLSTSENKRGFIRPYWGLCSYIYQQNLICLWDYISLFLKHSDFCLLPCCLSDPS